LLQETRFQIEPPNRRKFLVATQLGLIHSGSHHLQRPVVNAQRHREWMSIFSAVRDGKSRWVAEAAGRAVKHLRHRSKGENSPRSKPRGEKELCEIFWTALAGGGKGSMKAPKHDVLRRDRMMGRHLQMRERELVLARFDPGDFCNNPVRTLEHEL